MRRFLLCSGVFGQKNSIEWLRRRRLNDNRRASYSRAASSV